MLFHHPGGSAFYMFGVLHLLAFCIAQGKIYALLRCNLGVLLLHLGCTDFVRMFDYCVMVIYLSMNVMAVCTFHPPGHFVSRAPRAILGVLLLQPYTVHYTGFQPVYTAYTGFQPDSSEPVTSAYMSCLCLSVCLGNYNLLLCDIARKTASACFFQVYQNKILFACQCCFLRSIGRGCQVFSSFNNSSAQSAQRSFLQLSFHFDVLLQICDFHVLHLILAFCVALRSPSVFGSRLSVTSVSSFKAAVSSGQTSHSQIQHNSSKALSPPG